MILSQLSWIWGRNAKDLCRLQSHYDGRCTENKLGGKKNGGYNKGWNRRHFIFWFNALRVFLTLKTPPMHKLHNFRILHNFFVGFRSLVFFSLPLNFSLDIQIVCSNLSESRLLTPNLCESSLQISRSFVSSFSYKYINTVSLVFYIREVWDRRRYYLWHSLSWSPGFFVNFWSGELIFYVLCWDINKNHVKQ